MVLERLEKLLPARTFSWGARSVKFAHYCGVISLGNLTLEILPKIYGKEQEPGACRKALVMMLQKARVIKPAKGGTAQIALQKHVLLEIFILHFCDLLHAELMQGMIRHYVTKEESLPVLRGRLRIEKQLKQNLAHRERLFCRYDELSADNTHNRIIKYVLHLLLRLSTGVIVRKQLTELLIQFDDISDVLVDVAVLDRLQFDRVTNRYEPIFTQCRWFLQGLHPDVTVGDAACLTLLFDMNRLFEAYVAASFRKLAWQNGFHMREQGPRKYMMLQNDRNEQLFLMKPDMVFLGSNKQPAAIADAKWKMLDEREKKLGVSQADLYQMVGYATRYRVDKLALIYPKQQWLREPIELQVQGTTASLVIIPIDIAANDKELARFPSGSPLSP